MINHRLLLRSMVALALFPAVLGAQSDPPSPPPGRLVEVGDHAMHIVCSGPEGNGPTVVLEAGGGGFSSHWSAVQEALAGRVRSCAYDRAGLGWSEPGPAPRTMEQEAFELHALLDAAGIARPVVLVGQSIGGLLARRYAADFPEDVAAMVLVDPTHESDMLYSLRVNRWVRLPELALDREIPEPRLTGPVPGEYDPAQDYQPEDFRRILEERQAEPQPLGSRPLIVIGAGVRPLPPGTTEEVWGPMRWEKDGQKIDLSRLSSNSRFLLARDSGHNVHFDDPGLVAEAIVEVVEAVGG